MPTSHRAPRAARGRALLIGAGVVVVVVIGLVIALTLGGGEQKTPPAAAVTNSPTPSPSAAASPSAVPPPSAKAKPSKAPAPTITAVPASPPHEITIGNLVTAGFSDSVDVVARHLIPKRTDKLQRLGTRGVPGSPGKDTVIVVGAANDRGTGVLDDLHQVRTGQTIALTTQTGTLTYKVTTVRHASPTAVLNLAQVREHRAGRLVIDCANYVGPNRTNSDLVVIAQLVKAQSLRP